MMHAMVAVRDSALGPGNPPAGAIEDQVLGWIKVYNYTGATLPIKLDHRVYYTTQLSIAQLFAQLDAGQLSCPRARWVMSLQFRNAKLSPYNQNTAALPNSYGAMAKLYLTGCDTARTRRESSR